MDIFDEEDLLAIANDEDSSSSHAADDSCASFADTGGSTDKINTNGCSGEKQHAEAAFLNMGNNHTPDEDSDDESDGDFIASWLTDLKNCEQKSHEKMLEICNEESKTVSKVSCNVDRQDKHDNDIDVDTSTSDEDRENIVEAIYQDIRASMANETTCEVEYDDNRGIAVDHDVTSSASGGSENERGGLNSIEIQLGSKARCWISDYNSMKSSKNKRKKISGDSNEKDELKNEAIIGIQRDFKGRDGPAQFPPCLLMNLKKSDDSGKATRPAAIQHNVIIETTNSDACHDNINILPEAVEFRSKQYIGDAALCADHEERKSNRMIDCLARYDPHKKCYMLELVNVTVSNLRSHSVNDCIERILNNGPMQSDSGIDIAGIAPLMQREPLIVDPRIHARRAEDQVKKLKRGKR